MLSIGFTPAQDPGDHREPSWHDNVVVTANRVDQPLSSVAGNLTILGRREIEQSAAQTLDDFLRQVPGFSLFRRSSSLVAHPTAQGVTLRGISPSGVSRTLVLVDGVPANDAFGGWVYWSRIPLESVERIEILRGGGSSVWGNHALGGVINVVTRGIPEKGLTMVAGVGSHDDRALDLSGGRRYERLGWSLAGNYRETDGYKIVRSAQRGAIDIPAFSEQLSLSPRIEYDVSSQARLAFAAAYSEETRGNGTPLTNNETESGKLEASGDVRTRGGSYWSVSTFFRDQLFSSTFSAQAPDRSSERPALDQFAVDASELGGSAQWTKLVAGKHLLTAGADLSWIDGRTAEHFFWDGTAFLNERRAGGNHYLAGVFAQDLLSVSPAVTLTLGGRVDHWENDNGFRLETSRADGSVLRSETFRHRDEVTVSPKLAALYRATDRLAVSGSWYRSFRVPTLNELYRPFRVRNDITEANAELDPEILTGAEVGFDYSRPRVHGRLTAFRNRVENPIANVTIAGAASAGVIAPCGFVPAGGACRQRQNLGETRIVGFETAIEVRPDPLWGVSFSYLFSDGEVVDAPDRPELEGRRIAQVPRHQLSVGLHFDLPRLLGARVQTRYVGEQFEDDQNARVLHDYAVVDLSLWRSVADNLDLVLGIENLSGSRFEVGRSGDGLVTEGAPRRVHLKVRLRAGSGRRVSRRK